MNWTGGRLYRHSNNSHNAGSKNRKKGPQRFRSTITKDSNWIPFSQFPDPMAADKPKQDQAKKTSESGMTQAPSARPSHLQFTQYGDTPLEPSQQSQFFSRVDRAKHQLLNTKDWAAVAVTKPLELAFTQTEELERFGKRRKLTEHDRKRLADTGNYVSFVERPFGRTGGGRNTPSEMRTIKNLNITINGRRVPAEDFPTEGSSLQTNVSTQSMLLVSEGSADSRHSVAAESPRPRDAEEKSFDQHSVDFGGIEKSLSCSISPNFAVGIGSIPRSASPDVVTKSSDDEQDLIVNQTLSEATQGDNSVEGCQVPFNRRRFTIDDQIDQMVAENERRLNATKRVTGSSHKSSQEPQERLYYNSILSPRTLEKSDCYSRKPEFHLEDNVSPSGNHVPRLLYEMQRAVHKMANREENVIEPGETEFSWSTTEVYTSPTKIFGKSVVLENDSSLGPKNRCGIRTPRCQLQTDTQTHRPIPKIDHAILVGKPMAAICHPDTEFQVSRYEQCTSRHGNK